MSPFFGFPSAVEHKYANPERLADVMALIQVLAMDTHAHRSECGLQDELQRPPKTAATCPGRRPRSAGGSTS